MIFVELLKIDSKKISEFIAKNISEILEAQNKLQKIVTDKTQLKHLTKRTTFMRGHSNGMEDSTPSKNNIYIQSKQQLS